MQAGGKVRVIMGSCLVSVFISVLIGLFSGEEGQGFNFQFLGLPLARAKIEASASPRNFPRMETPLVGKRARGG